MANAAAVSHNFRQDLLHGNHAFGTTASSRTNAARDTFAIALYASTGSITYTNAAYSATGECTSSNYTAGGQAVTTNNPGVTTATSLSTGYWNPGGSVTWNTVTFTGSNATDLAMLYNSTNGNKAVATFALGTIGVGQQPNAGTFTLTMPANDATNALIRIT
jgi:hypothetical protein